MGEEWDKGYTMGYLHGLEKSIMMIENNLSEERKRALSQYYLVNNNQKEQQHPLEILNEQ